MDKCAYSPSEFCEAHSLARTTLYRLMKEGRGPRTFKAGRRTLISVEAAAEWRRTMEEAAQRRATEVR